MTPLEQRFARIRKLHFVATSIQAQRVVVEQYTHTSYLAWSGSAYDKAKVEAQAATLEGALAALETELRARVRHMAEEHAKKAPHDALSLLEGPNEAANNNEQGPTTP